MAEPVHQMQPDAASLLAGLRETEVTTVVFDGPAAMGAGDADDVGHANDFARRGRRRIHI
jgi:hypothetical protein